MKTKKYNTVVPWMNPDQFRKVYLHLYSKSIRDKRWAVDEIAVWETRCYPALPTAVEATVVLVRAVIQDMLFEVEKTLCLEGDIQMLYSMALVRFVNLTLEHHQSTPNKIGVYALAAQQNIPHWIIELRHDASHSFCPSLPILRMGAEKALCYLEDTFWKSEAENVQCVKYISHGEEEKILNLIAKYKVLQFERYENKNMRVTLKNETKMILKQINFYIRNNWNIFVNILVQPSVFTAAEDILRLLNVSDFIFLKEEERLSLPIKLQSFWIPLLRLIHVRDMIPNFLENLLIAQANCKIRISQKTAIAWALEIILGPSATRKTPLSTCFREKGLLLDFHKLLYACFMSHNKYSKHLLNKITEQIDRIMEQHDYSKRFSDLIATMGVYQGICVTEKQNSEQSNKEFMFTIDDLEDDMNEIKRDRMRATNEDNIWSQAPVNIDFANIPLGAILNSNSLMDSEMETVESEVKRIDFGPHPDDNFIILNENDDEGTIEEVTVDTNMYPASFLPEQFGMLYTKS